MENQAVICVEGLSRTFEFYEKELGLKGSFANLLHKKKQYKEAVREISFAVAEGEVVGFLGPNGAGKTTTMKMLAGILHPSGGSASVLGYIPWERKRDFKRRFSIVMGQKSQLWPDLPAGDSLRLTQCIYEIPDDEYIKNTEKLIDMLGVRGQLKTQVRRLSLGERMKFELISCLIYDPQVIFLDEPTIGLDLVSQRLIRDFIKTYNSEHKATILITSHNMADIENLCRRVMVINRGAMVFDGDLGMIREKLGNRKRIHLDFSEPVDRERLSAYGEILEQDAYQAVLSVPGDASRHTASRLLEDLPVKDFTIQDISLEEGIVNLYEAK